MACSLSAYRAVPAGLFAAQTIASVQVFCSGRELQQTLAAVAEAGYLPVPGPHIAPPLISLKAALCGGLFFTLSLGAGLSLITFGASWSWRRLFNCRKTVLFFYICLWAAGLTAVAARGLSWFALLYVLCVPAAVWAADRGTRRPGPGPSLAIHPNGWCHCTVLVLTALLWAPQINSDIFIRIRDHLLLSNKAGILINDFYYRYTLYAAEAFKAPHQKMIKAAHLGGLPSGPDHRRIQDALISHDYLIVDRPETAVLDLIRQDGRLMLQHDDRTIVHTTAADFTAGATALLKQFSTEIDRNAALRRMTFLSLVFGFPLLLYIGFYSLFCALMRPLVDRTPAVLISTGLCLLLGGLPAVMLHHKTGEPPAINDAVFRPTADRDAKLARLKHICADQQEIAHFAGFQRLAGDPDIAVRYWFARALSISRRADTRPLLHGMLADPHPNVVCQALYGLGRRKGAAAVDAALQKLAATDHWYVQWYAYTALKALGWRQQRLN